jgi:hypothetical protein
VGTRGVVARERRFGHERRLRPERRSASLRTRERRFDRERRFEPRTAESFGLETPFGC